MAVDDPVADLKRRSRRETRPVRAWWRDHELDSVPMPTCRKLVAAVIEEVPRQALAVLHQMRDQLRVTDLPLLARVAEPDPRPVVRLLANMLARDEGRAELAIALGRWRDDPHRAAACLALATIAPRGEQAFAGFVELALSVCATCVWSHVEGDQRAVGVLLGKLAEAAPTRVEAFVRRYARLMTRTCVRNAIAHLPARDELLALHRRATSI